MINSREWSKHAKYRDLNPISKYMVTGFFRSIRELFLSISPTTVLDLGCGEGLVLKSLEDLMKNKKCYAIDHDPIEIKDAKMNSTFCEFSVGSIYEVPFEDNFADVVFCTEVLEHLDDPNKALDELHRVTSEYAILSVPNEPLWRILNMLRFKYLKDLGNTPDHWNHWSSSAFKRFVGRKFTVVKELNPVPWNCLLCKKNNV
ncbi:MAG TPA: class I SAM-dependent methyltransferase [Flavobacteriales bacterium]|nr:class I SAM-dependent methyltransferase [Flavobacteriales bacterium]HIN39805.1 class I SAM-dependent methyltransferase [Flavobacteriales bacterium]